MSSETVPAPSALSTSVDDDAAARACDGEEASGEPSDTPSLDTGVPSASIPNEPPMRLLYICQRVPFPPNRGDKIASFNAIEFLSQRHDVTIACLADSEEELSHARSLEERGYEVIVERVSSLRSKFNMLGALVTGTPLSVANFRSGALADRIRGEMDKDRFDLVIPFSSSMGQYYDPAWKVPMIVDFVDMDSRKWEMYVEWHSWPKSQVFRMEARRLLEYERLLAHRAECSLIRTEAEREDCARLIPGARFEVLSNGVDLEYFSRARLDEALVEEGGEGLDTCAETRAARYRRPPADLVFTGVMDYFPNVQGCKFFIDDVFPLVRARHPEATFTIVGARPTAEVEKLGALPGVTVTGPQRDLRPFIAGASVAVVPLLLARGIQNKVLEAMSMEVPAVVTSSAFRGVDAREGEGVLLGTDAASFASKVNELLDDRQKAEELGRAGRKRVEERYVWSQQLQLLEDIALEVVSEKTRSRS